MAFARVVSFDGVSAERMQQMVAQIEGSGGPPDGVPATELLFLHDADGERALAVLLFDSEEDYSRGDATLDAMPADETPGSRTSVTKYRVASRMTS